MKTFEVEAVVEIPHGSKFKYEIKAEKLTVDRPLPVVLPYNYGYLPNTLHDDGDPTDICIIGDFPIFPGAYIKVSVLGAFKCIDNGESDDKLVSVVLGESHSDQDIERGKRKIKHYLSTYKEGFIVNEFVGPEKALKIVKKDEHAYTCALINANRIFGKP
jgi:inorganic pyrophosphatase